MTDSGGLIRFDMVGMRYGDGPEVLRDLSFALEPASFHYLTGPSGAGKSSLLKLMYLAHRPSRGHISMFGRDVSSLRRRDLPELRRRIGVVFQDYNLLDHLSAFDNVALPLRIIGMGEAEISRQVTELLEWVGLAGQIEAHPPILSGGQRQRVAIARAVIGRPQVLIADEPTGSVDNHIALRLLHLFEEMNRQGATVIIATHNRALIHRFKHPRLHLENGLLSLSHPDPVGPLTSAVGGGI